MNNIVCISTSNFEPFPTRKQNVMKRLKNSKILYFNPPISMIAPIKSPALFKELFAFFKKPYSPQDNILVYSMPPVMPFFNKFRVFNKINQFFLSLYVNSIIKRNGFSDVVAWCYSPTSCDIIPRINCTGVVYDCVDRHSAYPGMINKAVVDKMEAELASRADVVFATADGLYKTLKEYNDASFLIPNGCNYELFSNMDINTANNDIQFEGKVFGFVGMLQECIDYDLIEALAIDRPNDTVVIIGKALPGVSVENLEKYSNIKMLGLIRQEYLPQYISKFDVNLNLFRSDKLSEDVSPLKFYEYLANGKPIVSTRQPRQVNDYKDVVYICDDRESFLNCCRDALKEHDDSKRQKRIEYAKKCSWENRVMNMEEILYEKDVLVKER